MSFSAHPPRFQYPPSNPSNSGLRACTGTTTSSARIALVMPTNMVRLSIARNSSRSSAGTLVGTFVYQPLSLKPATATTGNSKPFADLSVSTLTPGRERFSSCPGIKVASTPRCLSSAAIAFPAFAVGQRIAQAPVLSLNSLAAAGKKRESSCTSSADRSHRRHRPTIHVSPLYLLIIQFTGRQVGLGRFANLSRGAIVHPQDARATL